jgi:hypothetical protein
VGERAAQIAPISSSFTGRHAICSASASAEAEHFPSADKSTHMIFTTSLPAVTWAPQPD